ncbi:MAG: acetate--CoA ligase [Chitinophagales bacterium]|nr:acetate--CoA ligase [Chitinophagales bacterium]MDW8428761.1 acetate--CoA ligase [Chitinophagales bacterium]
MALRITSLREYDQQYQRSIEEPEAFWSEVASDFHWQQKWDRVFSGGFEHVDFKWFEGARLNITENCLDRHLKSHASRTALIWEPNDPKENGRTLTYRQLYEEVCRCSNLLRLLGIGKGDTVCIYLPMIPELVVSVLACARIGAVHSVVFGGFSAGSLADRIRDSQAKLLITADGYYRGSKPVNLKSMADEALRNCPSVKHVLVVNRSQFPISIVPGRDSYWDQLIAKCSPNCEPESMEAEDPLFILYTSGSTGKPKGLLHTTAGYMVYAGFTFLNVFQYRENEIFWCTADVGWITGHTYVVYGPLLNAATILIYEGVPHHPSWSRWWDIIDKYRVNIFYTAPTAIRSFEAQGDQHLAHANLSSLRLLGSVGEPINEEAWHWFFQKVGKGNCPIVDTWWQTETGGIAISTLAGITPQKPAHAGWPLPGIVPVLFDDNGRMITQAGVEGNLCLARSWPGQARTIYGDHQRFIQTYFSRFPGYYFTGDGCRRTEQGFYRITGRVDDVIKVSGHRLGTAELENAINQHPEVVESAVVNIPHAVTGEAIVAFVVTRSLEVDVQRLEQEVIDLVTRSIGPIAKPKQVIVVTGLPKTRSGKIMRRILRKLLQGETSNLGDSSTLLNPEIVTEIAEQLEQNPVRVN